MMTATFLITLSPQHLAFEDGEGIGSQLMLGVDCPDAVTCLFIFSQLLPKSPFQVFDLAGFLLFFVSLTFA
jgi:hypothetical protein